MINLLVGWHTSKFKRRRDEMFYVLKKNLNLPNIDKVYLFLEDGTVPLLTSTKMEYVNVKHRMTYKDYFEFINSNNKDDYNIISNSDIFFNGTINKIIDLNMEMRCIALSRYDWDMNSDKQITDTHHEGQDVWIFKGLVMNIDKMDCDFYLGVSGCDLRMNYELIQSGYDILNINNDIMIFHVHESKGENTYRYIDCVTEPYIRIPVTSISDWR